VLSSLKGLAKDNSGYDLSQLFIGSEGTLGVVTRACLRLHPKPVTQAIAFCAMPSLDAAMALLKFLRGRLGTLLSGFELIFDPLMSEMTRTLGLNAPVRLDASVYVLADIQGMSPGTDETVFAEALGQAMEDGLVTDAALSQSDREFRALWALRDDCNRYLFALNSLLSLDVSLPLPRMGQFLTEAGAAQQKADPSARDYVFGHLGDGNLHYCVVTDRSDAVAEAVFRCVERAGGSISAEHGIGLDKKPYLHLSRSEAEIATMRRLKAALDPNGILNPGRIFDMDDGRTLRRQEK
jgi:FAD/FMN-containing dehydrogenase